MNFSIEAPELNDSLYDSDYPEGLITPCSFDVTINVSRVLGLYVHTIICILGFVGNSLVIVTYALYKKSKSMTDVYLLNVAIADLLFVLALPLLVYNEQTAWSMGPVACKLLRGSYSINLYSGMLLLACISTDRYIAIVQARRSFRLRSLSYSRIICVIVWLFAILVSVPTFYFYHWYEPSHTNDAVMFQHSSNATMLEETMLEETMLEETMLEETMLEDYEEEQMSEQFVCEFRADSRTTAIMAKVAIPSIQLAVGFFLPLLIMIFCYAAVIVTLLKAKNFQRHKAVRVVLAVVAVFVLCHLPYNVALLCDTVSMFQHQSCASLDLWHASLTVLQSVAYLHSCLNPLLYAFIGVKFRNHFRRIFRDLWCVGKKYMTPRRFSRVTSETYVTSVRRSVDGSSDGSSFTM
ncbi:C-C chemokine receptor type 6a [Leuresthes tenuis]|uniref:C-C chemokine receptor type 6a n=1 Tax=Leuresthes tenuis TaxID=355514 RepID=UPI003B5089FB